jgi:hypothetical protein
VGVIKRDVRFRLAYEAHAPATRAEAEKLILQTLEERVRRRERTLVLFDFPLGLPRGLAAGLKLAGSPPWKAVWDLLGKMVKDKTDNTNNRFGVGSEINRRLTGGPFPFWGCPPRDALTTLQPKRGREHGPSDIPEFRYAEVAAGSASPVWKLYYAGATGPLAILGVPMVRRLKAAFGGAATVWPFETGWKPLAEADLADVGLVMAETSLGLAAAAASGGEPKEAAQVRALLEQFARLDETGKLGAAFGPRKGTAADVVETAQTEEGWMLGV